MASKARMRTRAVLPGMAVDAYGDVAYDPTPNVIALVQANAASVAALRDADIKFNDAVAAHLKEMNVLQAAFQETLRTSDLDRLDKTRQVDVLAASASAAALATAVQTLASTADRNADALRNLVNATAQTMAKQTSDQAATLSAATDSLVKDINARIAELQKSSYQGVGKSSVADPMMSDFIIEMKKMASGVYERQGRESVTDPAVAKGLASIEALLLAQAQAGGQKTGGAEQRQLLTWVLAVVVAVLSIYTFTQRQAPAPAPQIIYAPAPPGTQLPSAPPSTVPR